MSIQTEIERIISNIANTYSVLESLGADMPSVQNSDNLSATASTVKATGGGGALTFTRADGSTIAIEAATSISVNGGTVTKVEIDGATMWQVYAITYNLIDCTASTNSASYVVPGASYSTRLRHSNRDQFCGYISVTMGGKNITEDVCTFDDSAYDQWNINIPSVTGDVRIHCDWFGEEEEEEEDE